MNWAKQHEATGGKLVIDWESLHARFRANDDNKHQHRAATNDDGNGVDVTAAKAGSTKHDD